MSVSSEDCHGPPFPTAEECVNKLMSISTFVAVANTPTTSLLAPSPSSDDERSVVPAPSTNIRNDQAAPAFLPKHVHRIGNGKERFEIKVCVEHCYDMCHLLVSRNQYHMSKDIGSTATTNNLWLSYRFMNTVVQSDMLSEEATLISPMVHAFRIQCSFSELVHYFHEKKNAVLKVHLCTEGEILGTSYIDLRQLIAPLEYGEEFQANAAGLEGRMIHHEYILQPRGTHDGMIVEGNEEENRMCKPRIAVRLCIDRDSSSSDANISERQTETHGMNRRRSSTATISLSTSTQTTNSVCVDRASSPRHRSDQYSMEHIEEKANVLNSKEAELSNKEKEILQQMASLERKRCEWEQWRHREEIDWQEKLRQKEAAMLKAVEERVQVIEKERKSALELSKNEYDKLETRLRKALIDVEAKERQLKHAKVSHQSERKSKLAELELREKLMKEELKLSIEIEVRLMIYCSIILPIYISSHGAYITTNKASKSNCISRASSRSANSGVCGSEESESDGNSNGSTTRTAPGNT